MGKYLSIIFTLMVAPVAYAQFNFSNTPVLVNGPALQQGAVYQFLKVDSELDALIEIASVNNASLDSMASNEQSPNRAFQPQVSGDKGDAYVEFHITFVDSKSQRPTMFDGTVSVIDLDSAAVTYTISDVSDFTLERSTNLSYEVTTPQVLKVTGGAHVNIPLALSDSLAALSARVNSVDVFSFRVAVDKEVSHRATLLFDDVEFSDPTFVNINDSPLAKDDQAFARKNAGIFVAADKGVLANDVDIDIPIDSDRLRVRSFSSDGETYVPGANADLMDGALVLESDGSYVFTPAANSTGIFEVDYLLEDGRGGTDVGELMITVGEGEIYPLLTDDSATLSTLSPLIISVLSNDVDPEDRLDIASLTFAADLSTFPDESSLSGDSKVLTIPGEGVWRVSAGGNLEFTPEPNTSGVVVPVTYQVADDDGNYYVASVSLLDGIASDPVAVLIDEDRDDNGYISDIELIGEIDVSASLPIQARQGDVVFIEDGQTQVSRRLSALELSAGVVAVSFSVPFDGTEIIVEAYIVDEEGNQSLTSNDTAILDITATEAPQVIITADIDNSGFISASEYMNQVLVEIVLPASAAVNDTVSISNGTTTTNIVLIPTDIANGSVSDTLPISAEGDTLSVLVQLTDGAGNRSRTGSDSAMVDTVAPDAPFVSAATSVDSTPVISGGLPFNQNYLLTVEVNGITYSSGDGHLSERGDGTWSLTIPLLDSLSHGVYDVVARVTDMAGNSSTDVTRDELDVDLMLPIISVANVGPTSDPAPGLSGATDQHDDTVVTVSSESGIYYCAAVVDAGQWFCRPEAVLSIGENALIATINDDSGNSAFAQFSVVIVVESDSDSDNIPDSLEGTADFDDDGVPNYLDPDSDNDTIPDAIESAADRDGDGIRNFLDIDSDNDGLIDSTEARLSAVVGSIDGFVDESRRPVDTDADSIPDYLDHDSDNDGIPDLIENNSLAAGGLAMRSDGRVDSVADYDFDGVPNYIDLDSDGDGISDVLESNNSDENGNGQLDIFSDTNRDGVADGLSLEDLDWDSDGKLNSLDADSDGDGVSDLLEAGGTDSNNDGIHDSFIDGNKNGITDSVDSLVTQGADEDADGIDDRFDIDYISGSDDDSDGIANEFDDDANGDGLADVLNDVVTRLPDADSDGQADVFQSGLPQLSSALRTGVGGFGGGCVVRIAGEQNANNRDYLLVWLLVTGLAGVSRRSLRSAGMYGRVK